MNTVNAKVVRRLLAVAIVAALLLIAWQLLFKRPFVKVIMPADTNRVVMTSADGDVTAFRSAGTGSHRIVPGDYVAIFYKDDTPLGIQNIHIKPLPLQTITGVVDQDTDKTEVVLHQNADLVTPLGNGYLFLNKKTRGVEYANASGFTDISGSLELLQAPEDADEPTYNTVINIEPTSDGSAVITTTAAIFLLKDIDDITKFPPSNDVFLNFTASAYDAKTKRIFVLSAGNNQLFYYDITNPETPPKKLVKTKKEVNRLAASGGKVVAYFDDIPSLEPKVLDAYAKDKQLAPVVYDATNGKEVASLDAYQGTTQLSISDSGSFIAIKKKLATTMAIITTEGRHVQLLPASDARGSAWRGDTIFIGRGGQLWSFNAAGKDATIQRIADIRNTIVGVRSVDDNLFVSDVEGFTHQVLTDGKTASDVASVTIALSTAKSQSDGYYTAFVATGNKVAISVETSGDTPERGDEEIDPDPNVSSAQYQAALVALGNYAVDPRVSVVARDMYTITPYQYAGYPTDELNLEQ